MEFVGSMGKFYTICQWCTKLVYLNLLWIMFSLAGLVILGIFPATVAMFSVVRKWLIGEGDTPILQTFITSLKAEFFKANVLGWILLMIGYVLFLNITFAGYLSGWVSIFVNISLVTMSIIYVIVLLYIFPVVVHYRLKLLDYMKYAFVVGASNLALTIVMMVGVALLYVGMRMIPGLMIFVSGSLLAIILMWCSLKGFDRLGAREGKL